ncbi:hypothetical protein HPB47_017533, partial [Ixodes persulcatus]
MYIRVPGLCVVEGHHPHVGELQWPQARDGLQVYRASQRVAEVLDLVSFPRSGSHWIQQILQLILNSGESTESYVDFARKAPYLENRVPEGMESPRLLRMHFSMDRIKVDPKAKYVYVARNPWDCCVSCYHYVREIPVCEFQDGTFDEFLDAFLEGQSSFGDFFDHVLSGYRRRKERN